MASTTPKAGGWRAERSSRRPGSSASVEASRQRPRPGWRRGLSACALDHEGRTRRRAGGVSSATCPTPASPPPICWPPNRAWVASGTPEPVAWSPCSHAPAPQARCRVTRSLRSWPQRLRPQEATRSTARSGPSVAAPRSSRPCVRRCGTWMRPTEALERVRAAHPWVRPRLPRRPVVRVPRYPPRRSRRPGHRSPASRRSALSRATRRRAAVQHRQRCGTSASPSRARVHGDPQARR